MVIALLIEKLKILKESDYMQTQKNMLEDENLLCA